MTIYVALLDEGVECRRPVDAIHKDTDIYTITSVNPDPEDEHRKFNGGDHVRCVEHTFSGGIWGLKVVGGARGE